MFSCIEFRVFFALCLQCDLQTKQNVTDVVCSPATSQAKMDVVCVPTISQPKVGVVCPPATCQTRVAWFVLTPLASLRWA